MILIKSVNHYEVSQDPVEIMSYPPMKAVRAVDCSGTCAVEAETFQRELVNGRRFKRPSDGMDIVVGMSKKVQDILGIQYEAFENLQRQLDINMKALQRKTLEVESQSVALKRIAEASLWQRLQYLFTGCMPI